MQVSSRGITNQGKVRHANEVICRQLTQIANDNGGPDNITVIVIHIL